MATVIRERRLVNPARGPEKKRKLSEKQILFFGSAQQRAALKRKKAAKRAAAKAVNPGRIMTLKVANPAKKKNKGVLTMATSKRPNKGAKSRAKAKKSNPSVIVISPKMAHAARSTKKKRNPARHSKKRNPARKGKRRNPAISANPIGAVGSVLISVGGAVGTKLLTQLALGARNTGIVGYVGNGVVGVGLYLIATKLLKSKTAGQAIIAGTTLQMVLRGITDFTPFGSVVKNLGMGDYQASSFLTPQAYVDPRKSAEIALPAGLRNQIAAAVAASAPVVPQVSQSGRPVAPVSATSAVSGMNGVYSRQSSYAGAGIYQ